MIADVDLTHPQVVGCLIAAGGLIVATLGAAGVNARSTRRNAEAQQAHLDAIAALGKPTNGLNLTQTVEDTNLTVHVLVDGQHQLGKRVDVLRGDFDHLREANSVEHQAIRDEVATGRMATEELRGFEG